MDAMIDIDLPSGAMPKYRQIAESLRTRLVSGAFAPGEKLPTDAELSTQFETSRLTVIKALRQLESEGLVWRKAGSGTYVGLQSTQKSHSFGLLIPELGNSEIFEPICQGMARVGSSWRQELIWGNTSLKSNDREAQAIELCSSFIARKVDGVFFASLEQSPHSEQLNEQIVKQIDEAGIPIVLLDRSTRAFPEPADHDLIGIDNWREGFRITKHLLDLGRSRLGFLARPSSAPTIDGRIAGFCEAIRRRGLTIHPQAVLRLDPTDKHGVLEWIKAVEPDGIFCATDYTAGELMHTLSDLGVRVPVDIGLVGFDDVKYASLLPVPLTTVHQPCLEIGLAAMKAMLERLENLDMVPRTISLDCRIVIRESCGANLPR